MFKLLFEKILRTQTKDEKQPESFPPAAASGMQRTGIQKVSIFEDETYKVKRTQNVPIVPPQKAFVSTATVSPPPPRQPQMPEWVMTESTDYRTVQIRTGMEQGFTAFEQHVRAGDANGKDPRTSYLDNDANDPHAPGGYLPSYRYKILDVVDRHAEALVRKFKQLIVEDDYGTVSLESWNKEADYFIDRVLRPELGFDLFGLPEDLPRSIVTHRVLAWRCAPSPTSTVAEFDFGISGIDYEHFCAELLRAAGWNARVTQASGDQGVDIEATRNGKRVVFQCKKYSSPVGNTAVQQILAGKVFYAADVGVVVSNASFTPAAVQLARSTGILLRHHDDLLNFAV